MRVTRELREWLNDPVDACILGPTWAVWCHSVSLCGSLHWGRPTHSELVPLVSALDFICQPRFSSGVDVLMDNRALDHLDVEALMAFGLLVAERLPEWGRRIRSHAVILPEGLTGLLVAGLLPSLGPPYPFRFVRDPVAACEFLQRREAVQVLSEVEQLSIAARGASIVIDRLRARLAESLGDPSLETIAGTLGLSGRSLQRQLQGLGTSFSDEVRRARVAAAGQLLLTTDAKIEAIAMRVGFSSASRMSAAFRVELQMTPSQVRANGSRTP
jgi:AraC-like DNA-binding protein